MGCTPGRPAQPAAAWLQHLSTRQACVSIVSPAPCFFFSRVSFFQTLLVPSRQRDGQPKYGYLQFLNTIRLPCFLINFTDGSSEGPMSRTQVKSRLLPSNAELPADICASLQQLRQQLQYGEQPCMIPAEATAAYAALQPVSYP